MPDGNYTREISRLNAHANVRTVGYVSTNYAKRDPKAMSRDLNVYSAWADEDIGMHGIFLDETPALYDGISVGVLENVAREIRAAPGLGPNPMVRSLIIFSCL